MKKGSHRSPFFIAPTVNAGCRLQPWPARFGRRRTPRGRPAPDGYSEVPLSAVAWATKSAIDMFIAEMTLGWATAQALTSLTHIPCR